MQLRRPSPARSAGYTLIEFMVAITLSLIVLASLTAILISSMRARDEVERANQQVESGRYAAQLLTDDLQMAGYYGEFDVALAGIAVPAAKPDPCKTGSDLAALAAAMPLAVQGEDDDSAGITCISDVLAGGDSLVIRRVNSCVQGATHCTDISGAPYFQASLCSDASELLSLDYHDWFRLDTAAGNLNRTQRDCSTAAAKRRYLVHIYFLANNDNPGDGIHTLKRAELSATSFTIVPLVEGIDALQFEYGIDTDGDGNPDAYTADPDSYGGCTGAACQQNWINVMAIKIHLLARGRTTSPGYVDTKTYALGSNSDGSDNTVGPFNDAYKRHLFETVVRLNNPAGRRE